MKPCLKIAGLALLFLAHMAFAQGFQPFTGPGNVHSGTTTSGCGAINNVPTNNGSCGPVAPFPPAPASPTPVSSCVTLAANTNYQLTSNIGSSQTSACLNIQGPNTKVDLNGHAILGFANMNTDVNGIHFYSSKPGASVTCQTDTSAQACVYGNVTSSNFNTLFEVDHITVQNTTTNSTSSARNVFFDFSSINSGSLTGVPNISIHNMGSISATGITSTRIVNLQVQASTTISLPTTPVNKAYAVFYNNETTCLTNTAACQGIVAYGLWDAKIYSNHLINQLNNASSSETPRAMIFDQTGGSEAYNNLIVAQDGRAVRLRGSKPLNDVNAVHDNVVDTIVAGSNSNHVAAVHLGDPDSGSEVEGADIYNNVFNFTSGLIAMSRSATGINFHDNTVNCVSCGGAFTPDLYYLRSIGGGVASSANILRNTLPGLPGPQSLCDSGTTSLVCQSGTASGCTVNNSACALPTPPSNAFTWSNLQNTAGNPGSWIINKYQAGTNTVGWATMSFGQSSIAGCPAPPSGSAMLISSGRAQGTVNTSGTSVTWVSGTVFDTGGQWDGASININGTVYAVATVNSTTNLTLATSAGSNTGVSYQGVGAQNTLFYRHLGTSTGSTPLGSLSNMIYDVYACIPSTTTIATLRNVEFDPDIYFGNAWGYKMSFQCDSTSGNWRTWDSVANVWVTAPGGNHYACSFLSGGNWVTNTWHHIQWYGTVDQVNHTYAYVDFIVDGTTVFSNQNFTYSAEARDDGQTFNVQFQPDGQPVNGTYFEAIDKLTVTVW